MVEDGRRPSGGADALDPYGCPIHPGVPGSVRSVARSAHIPVERDVCATRAGIFLGNGPEMAKKKPLKAAKLVKHAARKTIGQPKATRAERSRIEKFKGGRVSKKKGEESGDYDSHE